MWWRFGAERRWQSAQGAGRMRALDMMAAVVVLALVVLALQGVAVLAVMLELAGSR